jgi:adhesin transport system outer membrane protein
MDQIAYPDDTDNQMVLERPVANMDAVPLTESIINRNTTPPLQVIPKMWYVSAGTFGNKNKAVALANHLNGLGFTAFIIPCREEHTVLVGPYEYRGHAGNGMERLKELAHVKGVLVTFKKPPKQVL